MLRIRNQTPVNRRIFGKKDMGYFALIVVFGIVFGGAIILYDKD